jgi:hypothetical protein
VTYVLEDPVREAQTYSIKGCEESRTFWSYSCDRGCDGLMIHAGSACPALREMGPKFI